jgi:chemotaxis response regulator CheB
MEKLKFTIRFIVTLAAIPVIMFSELTRTEKGTTEQKHEMEKVSVETHQPVTLSYASFFLQAVHF